MDLLTSVLLVLIFTLVYGIYDGASYNAGKRWGNHRAREIIRLLSLGLIALFQLKLWFLNLTIFYLIFDITFNVITGLPWNHIGTVSWIDKIWRKLGWVPQLITKVLLVLGALYLNGVGLPFLSN